jgi:uncharacterized membrane protein
MRHLESVASTNGKRSHWVAKAPLHVPIEWDADIVAERENAMLSWRSLPGADVDHAGTVRFRELPNGRGTEVRVRLEYAPPGGMVGVAVAKLFKTLSSERICAVSNRLSRRVRPQQRQPTLGWRSEYPTGE